MTCDSDDEGGAVDVDDDEGGAVDVDDDDDGAVDDDEGGADEGAVSNISKSKSILKSSSEPSDNFSSKSINISKLQSSNGPINSFFFPKSTAESVVPKLLTVFIFFFFLFKLNFLTAPN